ncbi:hypothetical protein HUG10_19200 (plasmid) [Halorarum halophilum]|uniref:Right handed beta helix region n=1 Tax=Halorarum halophilum TaxID=2743090 RepID=A0A7D5KAA2_9EURY|nr:hypothetical protein [Halobaculum halophilum]QLG29734.1 hypothetical protein HUG10_19200 [Halobaculum halophilum]
MSERHGLNEGQGLSRRAYLGGVIGGAASLSAVGTATASSGYDEVVDLVEEGADPNGDENIVPLLEEHADDDTLIELPEGEYLMTEQFRFTGYEHFGIVGDDATIVPGTVEEMDGRSATEGSFEGPTRLFRLGVTYDPGNELRFEGLTFDFTRDQSGFRAIEAYVEQDMVVRDIDIVGQHDIGSYGPAVFSVLDPNGISYVEGFRAPDGGAHSENTIGSIETGPTGILVPDSHEGKLWFRDCEVGPFPDNGLYVSGSKGRVVVQGGLYKNSNSASIRLGGNYSYIREATIVVDDSRPEDGNQRGIRLDDGEHLWVYKTEVRIEKPNGQAITVMDDVDKARIQDSTVSVSNGVNHAIVVRGGSGPTDIYDTEIEINEGGHALRIEEGGGVVDCWNVTVTGDADGSSGRHAIRCMRDDCSFRKLVVKQPGSDYRRGLYIGGDDCYVYSGYYGTSHIPIVNEGDETYIRCVTSRSFDGYEALKLLDESSDVDVISNKLYNGIWDKGSANLNTRDNEYPDG